MLVWMVVSRAGLSVRISARVVLTALVTVTRAASAGIQPPSLTVAGSSPARNCVSSRRSWRRYGRTSAIGGGPPRDRGTGDIPQNDLPASAEALASAQSG